jgi:Flp pilus assembly CpaF family ATPase
VAGDQHVDFFGNPSGHDGGESHDHDGYERDRYERDGYERDGDGRVPPQRGERQTLPHGFEEATRLMASLPGAAPASGSGYVASNGHHQDTRGWEDVDNVYTGNGYAGDNGHSSRGHEDSHGHDVPPQVTNWPVGAYRNGIAHHSPTGTPIPVPVSPSPVSPSPAGRRPARASGTTPEQVKTPSGSGIRVDYDAVRLLRTQIGEALTRWLRNEGGADDETIQREREQLAVEMVARYADVMRRGGTPMTSDDEKVLLATVRADMVGLGRLQKMLTDPTIEEVHILGCDRVRITRRDGRVELGDPIANSDDEMVEVLQMLARRAGATERSLSTSRPILDLQLPGGERLAATYQVSHRPYAVIRQHNTLDVTLDDIAGGVPGLDEMIDPLMRDFLRASVAAGLNIMVAGRAGAGKTTTLRALASEIPADEPFIILEESRELGFHRSEHHNWVMSFESRDGHGERGLDGRPAGEITIADLIPVSLRMGAQRIIVGEVRSREIVPMLEAMTTSRGSMCTIHARTAASVTDRIIQLALSHGPSMTPDLAQRTAANGLDLIVYVNLADETGIGGRKHRFVASIEEVTGTAPGGRIAHTTVFGPGSDGRGAPRHLPERIRADLMQVGYDVRQLGPWIEAGHGAWRTRFDPVGRRR